MLINALLMLVTEIALILCGMAGLRFLQKWLPGLLANIDDIPFALLGIIGLIGSTFLAAIASLFMRINWEAQLTLLLFIVIYGVFDRHWIIHRIQKLSSVSRRYTFFLLLLFFLLFVLVLATSADLDRSYDDGLYHLQSVLLISQHGAIPGLGLLHHRFAYNAIWHISSALWGFQFLHPENAIYFIITPVLMINFLIIFLSSIKNEKNFLLQWMNLTMLMLAVSFMVYYRYDFGAVDNNLPSFILTWLSILLFTKIVFHSHGEPPQPQQYLVFLLIVTFTWTVKISTLMLILPAGFIFYQIWRFQSREAMKTAAAAVVMVLPWIVRSLITSGYFLYPPPFKILGLPFKWQIPFAMVRENALVDSSWAKIPGASAQAVSEMSLSEWIPQWFQLLDRNETLLIVAVILAISFSAFSLFCKWKALALARQIPQAGFFLLWMISSLLFWFFSYPDPRFFYGPAMPIVASVFLSLAFWVPERYKPTFPMLTRSSLLFTTLLLGILFVRLNILSEIDYHDIKIQPAAFPQVEIRQVPLNGFTLNLPVSGNQCWASVVPCIPDKCSESVHLLGDSVFDGFTFIEPTP